MTEYNVVSWIKIQEDYVRTMGILRIDPKCVLYHAVDEDQPGKDEQLVIHYKQISDIWLGTHKFPKEYYKLPQERKIDRRSLTLSSRLVNVHVTFKTSSDAEKVLKDVKQNIVREGKALEIRELDHRDVLISNLRAINKLQEKRIDVLEKQIEAFFSRTIPESDSAKTSC